MPTWRGCMTCLKTISKTTQSKEKYNPDYNKYCLTCNMNKHGLCRPACSVPQIVSCRQHETIIIHETFGNQTLLLHQQSKIKISVFLLSLCLVIKFVQLTVILMCWFFFFKHFNTTWFTTRNLDSEANQLLLYYKVYFLENMMINTINKHSTTCWMNVYIVLYRCRVNT